VVATLLEGNTNRIQPKGLIYDSGLFYFHHAALK